MPSQFIRQVNLIVSNASKGLDLSAFRIVFMTSQSDFQTLNTMKARVYNLSDETSRQIQKEYSDVTLQAGYKDGNLAIIFKGTIKQVKRGRESQTETYTEIFAADGDDFYTYGTVNKTLAAGWTQKDAIAAATQAGGGTLGTVKFASILNPAPRGKVMYGMARLQLQRSAASTLTAWSIQNGKVTVTPITGYSDGEVVVINSATGMVGLPEQTEDGLSVACLLNPKIVIGTQIQIDQKSVQKASIPNDAQFLSLPKDQLDKTDFYPPTADDGFYKVLASEHEGDTRGNDFLTHIIALAIDKTAPQDSSVKASG